MLKKASVWLGHALEIWLKSLAGSRLRRILSVRVWSLNFILKETGANGKG